MIPRRERRLTPAAERRRNGTSLASFRVGASSFFVEEEKDRRYRVTESMILDDVLSFFVEDEDVLR